jgi:hypothetical protein
MSHTRKCFACGRKLGSNPYPVDTRDDQWVYVGSECYKLIMRAGLEGYQPPLGGPRLYVLTREDITTQTGQTQF